MMNIDILNINTIFNLLVVIIIGIISFFTRKYICKVDDIEKNYIRRFEELKDLMHNVKESLARLETKFEMLGCINDTDRDKL